MQSFGINLIYNDHTYLKTRNEKFYNVQINNLEPTAQIISVNCLLLNRLLNNYTTISLCKNLPPTNKYIKTKPSYLILYRKTPAYTKYILYKMHWTWMH